MISFQFIAKNTDFHSRTTAVDAYAPNFDSTVKFLHSKILFRNVVFSQITFLWLLASFKIVNYQGITKRNKKK